jgi:hypothetical protein
MNTRILFLSALPFAALLGCNADVCPKLYDKMKECAPDEAKDKVPEKSEFVEKCEGDRKKEKEAGTYDEEEEKEVAGCLDKSDCAEMEKCMSEMSEKRYTKKQVAEIKAALDSGDTEKMKDACQYVDEDNAELVTACKDVMPKLVEAVTAEVTKQRDAGEHDFGTCGDLENFAKAVGGDAEAKAKTLCEEAQAAKMVKKAKDEVATKIAAKDADMPYECKASLEDLGKLDTEWAKAKKAEIITACYQDLGKVIMEAKVPEMKYVCDFRVKEIYQAAKEHKLEDADLKAWIEKAAPLCDKAE